MSGELPARIYLLGMMGSGKSSVGPELAARLGRDFVDLDRNVEEAAGVSVASIFETEGEAGFRARETAALREVSLRSGVVVATGGGAVLDPANRAVMERTGARVWLRATVPTLAARTGDGAGRPLLAGDPAARLAALDAQRRPLYEACASVVVDVDASTPAEIADAIVSALEAE